MTKKERLIIAVLSLWTFMHLFIAILSLQMNYQEGGIRRGQSGAYSEGTHYWKADATERFFPFTYNFGTDVNYNLGSENFNINYYDFTEFLIYVGLVWLLFFLYRFIKKGES